MTEKMEIDEEYYSQYGIAEPCEESTFNKSVEKFLQLYVQSFICIAGLIGNTLVILTYAFYKRTKSMTDVYLLNVAIADVLFVVALPLIIYSERNSWAFGDLSCKILRGIYSINLYSGILLLACISLDRYLAIVQARRSFGLRSSTLIYSHLICAVVWLLALLLTLPTFIYYERYKPSENNFNHTGIFFNNETSFNYTVLPDYELMTSETSEEFVCHFRFEENYTAKYMKMLAPSSQVAVGFCLPLLVMGVCYSSVLYTLLRAKNFQRHKAVRVVLAVVMVFVACHLPYNATLLYDVVHMFAMKECYEEDRTQLALIVTESLAYLHCCLNPLLYAFIGVKFRNHFRKIVEDAWCLGKSYIGARRTSRVTSEAYFSSRRSVDSSGNENGTSFTM